MLAILLLIEDVDQVLQHPEHRLGLFLPPAQFESNRLPILPLLILFLFLLLLLVLHPILLLLFL
jgi:hypothetical protein